MACFVIPSLRGIFAKSKQNRLPPKIPRRLGMTKVRFGQGLKILNNLLVAGHRVPKFKRGITGLCLE